MKARSQEELDLYVEHRPCDHCGSTARAGKLDYTVDVNGDVATLEYEGRCGQCGNTLKFSVDAPVRWPAHEGFAYGGTEPSELFSPDELLAIAESLAAVPASPTGLDADTYFRHNGNLARAVALFDEVAKFLPPGAPDVPGSAFRGPRGSEDRVKRPDRYQRIWLEQRTRELRETKARYTAVNAQMNARDKTTRPQAPQGNFTREALVAHEQWIARGRTGSGRFSVENASVGALRLGNVKLAGARLVRVNLDRAHADFSDFSGAELIECTAIAANFAHTVFDGAQLLRCDFSRAHFGLTDFRDGLITEGRFVAGSADRAAWNRIRITGADLRELRFGDCVLDGAVLDGCDLRDASFDCVTPALDTLCSTLNTTFIRCDLRGASFEGRRLDGTRFVDCKLAGVKGKPRVEGPYVVERPDFSAAGDGSDIRSADAVRALWGR